MKSSEIVTSVIEVHCVLCFLPRLPQFMVSTVMLPWTARPPQKKERPAAARALLLLLTLYGDKVLPSSSG